MVIWYIVLLLHIPRLIVLFELSFCLFLILFFFLSQTKLYKCDK